jgi:hypothetical protein
MSQHQVRLEIPDKLLPIVQPRQFKVMHGGRGGGKSHTVAQVLILFAMQGTHRILCVREVQKSLAESSKRVIEDYIKRMGLSAYFDITQKPDCGIVCKTTGSTFSFSGLKDHTADSIKSFEGATLVWVEEAHSVTAHSWNILIPTIVRTNGAEIWATFNPDQPTDYVYERFVKKSDPDAWVCQINWRDNPWFNKAMNVERLKLKALNDDLYQHVWEGKCRTAAGLLFKRRWFKRYPLGQHPKNLRMYMSTDYAGAPDPDEPEADPDWNEFGVGGMDSSSALWLVDWYSGQEDAADWIPAWMSLVRKHKPLAVFEEKGTILRTIDGTIDREVRKARLPVMRHPIASASSKADRALGFAAYASTNDVWVPECPWGDRLIEQLCAFTGQDGKTDDMVDVCSLFGRGVDEMHDALPELTPEERGVKPFTVKWLNSGDRPATPAKRY